MQTKSQILAFIKSKSLIRIEDLIIEFKISRQMIHRYLKQLQEEGKIEKTGKSPLVFYQLSNNLDFHKTYDLLHLDESKVFEEIQNLLFLNKKVSAEILRIINYTFTEMLNNSIDHSQAKKVDISLTLSKTFISFKIKDEGVGIFKNIQKFFHLDNEIEAIQDLLKGKNTTNNQRHSGEGIFFTSKIASKFEIRSSNYALLFQEGIPKIKSDLEKFSGTEVSFFLNLDAKKLLKQVFDEYTNEDFEFSTTKIFVQVFEMGLELFSRSQAKRLLNNLDKFNHIILDFSQISFIGQGFADEIFRVYQNDHPETKIEYQNAEPTVEFMIKKVRKS
ncbi:MAG TPA: DUF4325 domain-containing protein [Candidatus Gracilibacteria bacterium]|nr:DUF4325 domain-containing protein [Candidatus Gracilibacteria bacterium]